MFKYKADVEYLNNKGSSIVTEVIRTVHYYYYYHYFLSRYFAQKNTQALFKYLNTLRKRNKEHKQLSFRCKAMNFCSNMCLKKYIVDKNIMNNFLLKYFFA